MSDGINARARGAAVARRGARRGHRPGLSGRSGDPEHDVRLQPGVRRGAAVPDARDLLVAAGRQAAVHAGGLGHHEPQVPRRALGASGAAAGRHEFQHRLRERAEQPERRERLYVCLPVRPVPRAARRQPRVRLGDVERQRQVLQRPAPRGDEELGEQGDGHPHECHHVHDEAPRHAAHGHDEGAACRTISTCSSTR